MVTFIHVSKNLKGNPNTLLIPMGVPALADLLHRQGIQSEILHLEIEQTVDPHFDLIGYLQRRKSKIACFDLHWHYQAAMVMQTVKAIKQSIPEINVVLGGYTATYFADQILHEYPEIDFVVSGDAELPLPMLAKAILRGTTEFGRIPNLLWRRGGIPQMNQERFIATSEHISGLRYSNFGLLRHYDRYMKLRLNRTSCLNCQKSCSKIFYYNCGRGCPVTCTFCGGGHGSQKILRGTSDVIFKSQRSAIEDLRGAVDYGATTWYTSFDPEPEGEYYIHLFDEMRKRGLWYSVQFECWSVPSKAFIDAFAKTFMRSESILILSPDVGSEHVRRKNKGFYFTNRSLRNSIEYISGAKGLKTGVFFTVGLIGETPQDVVTTIELTNELRQRENVSVFCAPVEMEPASPWSLLSHEKDVVTQRHKFSDYVVLHGQRSGLGYHTSSFSTRTIYDWIQLVRAEACCNRNCSCFLQYLRSKSFADKVPDPHSLMERCSDCESYAACFGEELYFS